MGPATHLFNCVLLFTGVLLYTCTSTHAAQAWVASRQPLCCANAMSNAGKKYIFSNSVNKGACTYKNLVFVEKLLRLQWVRGIPERRTIRTQQSYTLCKRAKRCSSPVIRFGLSFTACWWEINLESWIRFTLVGQFPQIIMCTQGGVCTFRCTRVLAHFLIVVLLIPSGKLISFVPWAVFFNGLCLVYSLFKGFPQLQ